jgi:hypothetical protein
MADKPTPETNRSAAGVSCPRFFDERRDPQPRRERPQHSRSSTRKWGAVSTLKAGDYVFIQFGQRREVETHALRRSITACLAEPERFVAETPNEGATPVLFTPIVRRKFSAQGTPRHAARIRSSRGRFDLNVAFVDRTLTETRSLAHGPEGSKKLYVWVAPR